MDKFLSVELYGKNDVYEVVLLPLTPYEVLDTLDKLRMTPQDKPEWDICAYLDYDELRNWIGSGSIYELNALCTKLAKLNQQERIAFDGLLKMDKDKGLKIIPMHRLLDLAYSTGQCHVLGGVHTLEQLGRFAAENGFVPTADNLPDAAFEMLDFRRIGEQFMRDEGGIIVMDGYVAQDGDLMQDIWKTLDMLPREPDYTILVEVGVMDTDRSAMLKLPSSQSELEAALDQIEAETWDEVSFRCADCRVPALCDTISIADSIPQVNLAARRLQQMEASDVLTYKALIAARGCSDLTDALCLMETLNDYICSPEFALYDDIARSNIRFLMGDEQAEVLLPYVRLSDYGRALAEHDHMVLTEYGGIERRDGQPIIAQGEQNLSREAMMM